MMIEALEIEEEDLPPKTWDERGLRVRATKCDTCIYRPGNQMQLRPGRVNALVEED
jgi:hypothetical protein